MSVDPAYPTALLQDRYGGTYSGGLWIAVAEGDRHGEVLRDFISRSGGWGDDRDAADFWWSGEDRPWLAVGDTPEEALANLRLKLERMKPDD